ncbi:hypothetical protein NX059_010012 [Plenodomus lindquistii]|nr:hypothetical protein NX059_010012 [Plenodomus lindquistii]
MTSSKSTRASVEQQRTTTSESLCSDAKPEVENIPVAPEDEYADAEQDYDPKSPKILVYHSFRLL